MTRRAVAAVLVALTLPLTVAADCGGSTPAAGTCRTLQHDLDAARTRMNAEQVGTVAYRRARDAMLAVGRKMAKAGC